MVEEEMWVWMLNSTSAVTSSKLVSSHLGRVAAVTAYEPIHPLTGFCASVYFSFDITVPCKHYITLQFTLI